MQDEHPPIEANEREGAPPPSLGKAATDIERQLTAAVTAWDRSLKSVMDLVTVSVDALDRRPAISLVGLGTGLIALVVGKELYESPLPASDYIATLGAGVALVAFGVAMLIFGTRGVQEIASSGVKSVNGPTAEVLEELLQKLGHE